MAKSWIVIVFLVGICGPAFSQRIAPGPVRIEVFSAADQTPLPAIRVSLGVRYGATDIQGVVVLDGVPEGVYPLIVKEPDYERFEMKVILGPKERAPIRIPLKSVKQVLLSGKVKLKGSNLAVPGARIRLTPKEVLSAQQGEFIFTSDWEGVFQVLKIPQGKYTAHVSSPGCEPLVELLEVKEGDNTKEIDLSPITQPSKFWAVLMDSVTRNSIVNAKVTLAEAWPLGIVAETRTNGQGQARFEDLRIGRTNWDPKISRNQVTLRVEAEGYAPVMSMVSLSGARLQFELADTLDTVPEQEPNNEAAMAQKIHKNARVELKIDPKGDRDVFRFRLKDPAYMTFTLGPKLSFEASMILLDQNGKEIRNQVGYVGKPGQFAMGLLGGEYFLSVGARYNNRASQEPLFLKLNCQTAADPLEPNDHYQQARLVRTGEVIRGCILPRGDQDFFRVDLDRPGVVRIRRKPHPLEMLLVISNRWGKDLTNAVAYSNRECDWKVSLPEGRFLLRVEKRYNNGESTTPYEVRLDYGPDDGVDDPPAKKGHIFAVRKQTLSSVTCRTINPLKDRDVFALPMPCAGYFSVKITAPIELLAEVRSNHNKVLTGAVFYPNKTGTFHWSAPGPMTAYLEVKQRYHSQWSLTPYTLETFFSPCDEMETMGRNDAFAYATPILPGETLRGSIHPIGDKDCYGLDLNHPAYLKLEGETPVETLITIHQGPETKVAEAVFYPNRKMTLGADLKQGPCFIRLQHRYNSRTSASAYAIHTSLNLAEPMETWPLSKDPKRTIQPHVGSSFKIDQKGDMDRLLFFVPQMGEFFVNLFCPDETVAQLYDELSGKEVRSWVAYANRLSSAPVKAAGPTRYGLLLHRRYNSNRYPSNGFVLVSDKKENIPAALVEAKADPFDPTLVTFTARNLEGMAPVSNIIIDGTLSMPCPGRVSKRYSSEGIFPVHLKMGSTLAVQWVHALGPREKKGVYLVLDSPMEGQTIESRIPCRIRALSYENAAITRVSVTKNNQVLANAFTPPFVLKIPWLGLGSGEQELVFHAQDAKGNRASLKRTIKVSEYFDLFPQDGAALSGNDVLVRWIGRDFGPTKVRVRVKGKEEWKEVVGESGQIHQVSLTDLESQIPYEIQPMGGKEPGPIRTVTRVKGLAFGASKYSAIIKRDYDQRLAISVRNHGEAPLRVKLECGEPKDSLLLVGFVGEGSQDKPFDLAPGEEQEFLLCLSAQDVVKEDHSFPIRITSENGFADEAEAAIKVKLPKVDLELIEVPSKEGDDLTKHLRLKNRGDSLTDLTLLSSNPEVSITPNIRHGMFLKGKVLNLTVSPQLFEGFSRAETVISAKAYDKEVFLPLFFKLKDNQKIFGVQLTPGRGQPDDADQLFQMARTLAADLLNPDIVDFTQAQQLEDTDLNGLTDRWIFTDKEEDILWVGDDSNGDGKVDFVHADLGFDGVFDYSAFKTDTGWERTNLVEAWLEMGFSLPWNRKTYKEHDLDVIFNDHKIASLKDVIPEGNYVFKIPPHLIKADTGEKNRIEIRSSHLRGGHYVVTSNFRIKMRLTGTRVFVAASSAEEAREKAFNQQGLTLDQCDYSLSSAEIRRDPDKPLKAGAKVTLSIPIRNLGAVKTPFVEVALFQSQPGKKGEEKSRVRISDAPLMGSLNINIPWKAEPGTHQLTLVADPDHVLKDSNRANNEAKITVMVAGDKKPPEIKPLFPLDQAEMDHPIFILKVEASDDNSISTVQVQVDNGLWKTLKSEGNHIYSSQCLLQPGAHVIRIKAADGGDNSKEIVIGLTVKAPLPEIKILEPEKEAILDSRTVSAVLECPESMALAAIRVNKGPWYRMKIKDGKASFQAPLAFGACTLDFMGADSNGVVRILSRTVRCEKQKEAGESPPKITEDGVIQIEGLGPVDLFKEFNLILVQEEIQ